MRAFVINKNDDYRLITRPDPVPGLGEVLIRMAVVGICGSDIHYFKSGACGDFVIREPFTPGHEAVGYVETIGPGVDDLARGNLVAINPSRPCGTCVMCRQDRANLCANNGFIGSASRFPHIQGMMSERFLVRAGQCFVVPPQTNPSALAMVEPLSVALHAVNRAGSLEGNRILVVGGGTIGLLIALAARHAGAADVVLSDPTAHARAVAGQLQLSDVVDPLACTGGLAKQVGQINTTFEASGTEAGLRDCIESIAPSGIMVQVGTLPPMTGKAPINQIMAKGLSLHGAFRFDKEFSQAVNLIVSKTLDVTPLISDQFPINQAENAFRAALNSAASTKVQVVAE